jgi:ferredoxin
MGIKKITLTHKRKDCIGCGVCAQIAPDFWKMNDKDGKADLCGSEQKGEYSLRKIDDVEKEKGKECSDACPMGIIRIEE